MPAATTLVIRKLAAPVTVGASLFEREVLDVANDHKRVALLLMSPGRKQVCLEVDDNGDAIVGVMSMHTAHTRGAVLARVAESIAEKAAA